jgi:tyrosyl-tRNA synthetase
MKKALARRIITDFHSADAATLAQKDFEAKFRSKGVDPNALLFDLVGAVCRFDALLVKELGLCNSKTEAQRQIKAGAVSLAAGDLDNPVWEKVTDPAAEFDPTAYPRSKDYLDMVFKVGRKQSRVRFKFQPNPSQPNP